MIDLTEDAKEILSFCIEQLADNNLYGDWIYVAQEICLFERDNDGLKPLIAEYTKLADLKSEGAFSATIDSWLATKH